MINLVKVILLSFLLVLMGFILSKVTELIEKEDLARESRIISKDKICFNIKEKAYKKTDNNFSIPYKEVYYSLMQCDRLSTPRAKVKMQRIYVFGSYGNYVMCDNGKLILIQRPTQPGNSF